MSSVGGMSSVGLASPTLLHQLYHTFESDLAFLSVLLLLCSFKFKEDFQLVVIKNIDSRARSHRRLQETLEAMLALDVQSLGTYVGLKSLS